MSHRLDRIFKQMDGPNFAGREGVAGRAGEGGRRLRLRSFRRRLQSRKRQTGAFPGPVRGVTQAARRPGLAGAAAGAGRGGIL
jgi:hypothetical protein